MKTLSSSIILITSSLSAYADWRSDIGWDDVQEWATLNGVDLPDTSSLVIGMTENGSNYIPDNADPQLVGESIVDVTGTSASSSGHATTVAKLFFGDTSSLTPSIGTANIYSVNDFVSRIQTTNPSAWTERVMTHAYVGSVGGTAPTSALSARIDQSTTDSGILHIVSMTNTEGGSIREVWGHLYNNLSVGQSGGGHSYGTTPAGYEGAGRQKPELVNPQGSSSNAAGATASVATFLRAANTSVPAVTIKSVMLAGADKSKFADWDNTETRPIDDIYGAGETNILNSFRILQAGENDAGAISNYGWDYFSPGGRNRFPQVYTFTIPDDATAASLCANLSWDRPCSAGSYGTLADLSLTLTRTLPSTASVFTSDSSINNIEHIWQKNLEPGTYTLTVDRNGATDADYALAWRIDVEANAAPATVTYGPTNNDLSFTDLTSSHPYILQRSTNLSDWVDVATLTSSADGDLSYSDANASLGEKVFYRLRYYTP